MTATWCVVLLSFIGPFTANLRAQGQNELLNIVREQERVLAKRHVTMASIGLGGKNPPHSISVCEVDWCLPFESYRRTQFMKRDPAWDAFMKADKSALSAAIRSLEHASSSGVSVEAFDGRRHIKISGSYGNVFEGKAEELESRGAQVGVQCDEAQWRFLWVSSMLTALRSLGTEIDPVTSLTSFVFHSNEEGGAGRILVVGVRSGTPARIERIQCWHTLDDRALTDKVILDRVRCGRRVREQPAQAWCADQHVEVDGVLLPTHVTFGGFESWIEYSDLDATNAAWLASDPVPAFLKDESVYLRYPQSGEVKRLGNSERFKPYHFLDEYASVPQESHTMGIKGLMSIVLAVAALLGGWFWRRTSLRRAVSR